MSILCYLIDQDLKNIFIKKDQGNHTSLLILINLYCFTVKHYVKCLLENHGLFNSFLLNQF